MTSIPFFLKNPVKLQNPNLNTVLTTQYAQIPLPTAPITPVGNNPPLSDFLNTLAQTESLKAELQSVRGPELEEYRDLYLKLMLTNATTDNGALTKEWISRMLSIANKWTSPKFDRVLEMLDFQQAFSLLVAGYRIAILEVEEQKRLGATQEELEPYHQFTAAVKQRLENLVARNPQAYDALNLKELSPRSEAMRFDASAVSYAVLQEIVEQQKLRLRNENIAFWVKVAGLSLMGTTALVVAPLYTAVQLIFRPPAKTTTTSETSQPKQKETSDLQDKKELVKDINNQKQDVDSKEKLTSLSETESDPQPKQETLAEKTVPKTPETVIQPPPPSDSFKLTESKPEQPPPVEDSLPPTVPSSLPSQISESSNLASITNYAKEHLPLIVGGVALLVIMAAGLTIYYKIKNRNRIRAFSLENLKQNVLNDSQQCDYQYRHKKPLKTEALDVFKYDSSKYDYKMFNPTLTKEKTIVISKDDLGVQKILEKNLIISILAKQKDNALLNYLVINIPGGKHEGKKLRHVCSFCLKDYGIEQKNLRHAFAHINISDDKIEIPLVETKIQRKERIKTEPKEREEAERVEREETERKEREETERKEREETERKERANDNHERLNKDSGPRDKAALQAQKDSMSEPISTSLQDQLGLIPDFTPDFTPTRKRRGTTSTTPTERIISKLNYLNLEDAADTPQDLAKKIHKLKAILNELSLFFKPKYDGLFGQAKSLETQLNQNPSRQKLQNIEDAILTLQMTQYNLTKGRSPLPAVALKQQQNERKEREDLPPRIREQKKTDAVNNEEKVRKLKQQLADWIPHLQSNVDWHTEALRLQRNLHLESSVKHIQRVEDRISKLRKKVTGQGGAMIKELESPIPTPVGVEPAENTTNISFSPTTISSSSSPSNKRGSPVKTSSSDFSEEHPPAISMSSTSTTTTTTSNAESDENLTPSGASGTFEKTVSAVSVLQQMMSKEGEAKDTQKAKMLAVEETYSGTGGGTLDSSTLEAATTSGSQTPETPTEGSQAGSSTGTSSTETSFT